MIEENAFNGSFNENVNKINCDSVDLNIPVSTAKNDLRISGKNKGG